MVKRAAPRQFYYRLDPLRRELRPLPTVLSPSLPRHHASSR